MRFQDLTGDDPVSFEKTSCTYETERALKVVIEGDDEEHRWIPKSVLHRDSEVNIDGDEGTLVVKKWFAKKEGLIDE